MTTFDVEINKDGSGTLYPFRVGKSGNSIGKHAGEPFWIGYDRFIVNANNSITIPKKIMDEHMRINYKGEPYVCVFITHTTINPEDYDTEFLKEMGYIKNYGNYIRVACFHGLDIPNISTYQDKINEHTYPDDIIEINEEKMLELYESVKEIKK